MIQYIPDSIAVATLAHTVIHNNLWSIALHILVATLAPTASDSRYVQVWNVFFVHACFYKRTNIHTHTPTAKTSMSTYQLRAKKMKLQLAVLLISTLLRGSIANDFDCITSFEKSFEDALATRNSCTDPDDEFTDDIYPPNCCQVWYYYPIIFAIIIIIRVVFSNSLCRTLQ